MPHGRTDNGGRNDRGAWADPPAARRRGVGGARPAATTRSRRSTRRCARRTTSRTSATLGTGNHFIEVCLDEAGSVWLMLHSGSRGVGNRIGTYFIELAKEDMRRHFINLPDADLAYLPEGTEHFDDYVEAVGWAQEYAMTNRRLMMDASSPRSARVPGLRPFAAGLVAVNCHHNYVEREHHYGRNVFVTRKGAVRARMGDLGVIPGSMGARSYIVRGLGNPESFCSVQPRRGPGDVAHRGAAPLHASSRPRAGDGGGRVPQGRGRHRRDARRPTSRSTRSWRRRRTSWRCSTRSTRSSA